MRRISTAVCASVLLVSSVVLAQEEQQAQPPPAGQNVVITPSSEPPARAVVTDTDTRMNTELIGSGLAIFGLSYGAAAIVAATSDEDADDRLWVPIAGPWMDLADRPDCDVDNSACDNETRNKILLVVDGIFQAGGAAAVVVGLFTPHRTQVVQTASKKVHVLPYSMGRGSPAIGVIGRF